MQVRYNNQTSYDIKEGYKNMTNLGFWLKLWGGGLKGSLLNVFLFIGEIVSKGFKTSFKAVCLKGFPCKSVSLY